MRIILFTNARDEKHIKEWVAHHLNLGFDFIHIFDHKSIEPIKDLFNPNPKLRIISKSNSGAVKALFQGIAVKIAKKENYDWMMYLDADEFLFLRDYKTIHDFIKSYGGVNQIGFNWVFFGSNYLDKEPEGMMLDNYIRCNPKINKHIKSAAMVKEIVSFDSAHYYNVTRIENSVYAYNSTKFKTNEPYWNFIPNTPYEALPAYVGHYINQAYSVYSMRRLSRGRDDGTPPIKNQYTIDSLHLIDNDSINVELRDKYSEKNAELMKTL